MNPVRLIYDDTPDFIPIPEAFRHCKTLIIIWPLDEDQASVSSDSRTNQGQRQPGVWSHLPPPAADCGEDR
jgi:hypothetical protein